MTGATGYVGGRLVPELLKAGYSVRCLVREPRKIECRAWRDHPRIEVVRNDLSNADIVAEHLEECEAAYYLVHSMQATGKAYAERDRRLAEIFAHGAAMASVGRIIYLGGLGELGSGLSEHLESRREVEQILGSTAIPVTAFRAAMIIGSGSASFEILRYLVERLPIMVTPSWVTTDCQPIAIIDVLHWMVRCLDTHSTVGCTLEIGGPDVMTYRELMQVMAQELKIPKRIILPLPVLTPRLSSGWISLVTPVSYRIARPLAEGLRNRVVVLDDETQQHMPHNALTVRESIRRALDRVKSNDVVTRWSVAGPVPGDPEWAGGKVFTDERSIRINAPMDVVFKAVCRVGGGHGWYAGNILWRIRGWMDNVVGGPGLRRGRRHPEEVEFGETLDFWRVIGLERPTSLNLLAEMKLPGVATLNFDLEETNEQQPDDEPSTRLTMAARFRPRGIVGLLYWYAVLPLHNIVFGGMLRGIRRYAERSQAETSSRDPQEPDDGSSSAPRRARYGRARLWLGISAVGTMVVASALVFALGLPNRLSALFDASFIGQIGGLAVFVLAYALLHVPFDVFGGYVLPRRHGRAHPSLPRFIPRLVRGVAVHSLLLWSTAIALYAAGVAMGMVGVMLAGVLLSLVLLTGRTMLAGLMSGMHRVDRDQRADASAPSTLPVEIVEAADEGFTGGIIGVLRPRRVLLPSHWRQRLPDSQFEIIRRRRNVAATSGAWRRGRLLALLFTWIGLAICALLVGPTAFNTAAGVMSLSLLFTIWTFLGLLILPTPSRAGVAEIDANLRVAGVSETDLQSIVHTLDEMQDNEPTRPSGVETIFHPVPSVSRRLHESRAGTKGFLDAARSVVFLSASGVGLLTRAVHCNCGRPSLWVFLPTD